MGSTWDIHHYITLMLSLVGGNLCTWKKKGEQWLIEQLNKQNKIWLLFKLNNPKQK